jgi:hypothetical protein
MLPVGMRKASITKARKTKARINAVMSHSKVFAISAARSLVFALVKGFLASALTVLLSAINWYPVRNLLGPHSRRPPKTAVAPRNAGHVAGWSTAQRTAHP